ncbi:MAG: hypothetical protein Q9167_005768 [Letrouitia subvulpina]
MEMRFFGIMSTSCGQGTGQTLVVTSDTADVRKRPMQFLKTIKSFERIFQVQLRFIFFNLDYDESPISSYIFLRVELNTHIEAFADGARKEECTHLRNLFILKHSEPTVEEKERFRTMLTALQLEPLQKTYDHQSGVQGRDWPWRLCILSGYLQGDQYADLSDDLVAEDRFSDLESSDGTIEPGEELTDEESGFSDSESSDDTTEPGEELTDGTK